MAYRSSPNKNNNSSGVGNKNDDHSRDKMLLQKEEEIRKMREMMQRLQAELEKERSPPPASPATASPSTSTESI